MDETDSPMRRIETIPTVNIEHRITTTSNPLDMTGWCVEKSASVVETTTELLSLIQKEPSLSNERREEILALLRPALWNGTKLVAFATGRTWNPEQVEDLWTGGERAFRRFAIFHGLMEDPKKRAHLELDRLRASVLDALSRERWEGRPLIHTLCNNVAPILRERTTRLVDLTEQLTMGEIEWGEYKDAMAAALDSAAQGIEAMEGP